MTVGAAMFKNAAYTKFRRDWKPFLNRWQAGAFHATDFYPGGGEFKRTGKLAH